MYINIHFYHFIIYHFIHRNVYLCKYNIYIHDNVKWYILNLQTWYQRECCRNLEVVPM